MDKSPTETKHKNLSDSEQEEEKVVDEEQTLDRQDQFCVFTNERELRSIEQIRFKISQFTGVVIRTGTVGDLTLFNLLEAIEQDAAAFVQQTKEKQAQQVLVNTVKAQRLEMKGMDELFQTQQQTPNSGIIHLRFEDVTFSTKAVTALKVFLTKKQLIETLVLSKVEFQQPIADFKDLVGGMQFSIKLRKVGITNMYFDEEMHGKILGHLLNDCRTLREFDCSNCEFFHPKVFFDMCTAFIGDKCRVNILRLKGIQITQLEGKIIQFVLMKNKLLHTIDLSGCKVDSAENLEFFLQKIDKFSNIRHLTLDNMLPDMSPSLEILSEALSENTKLEVLIMRENKLKWVPYCSFWENLRPNTTLKKINVSKTDLSDRVLEKLCFLLENPSISLVDLDLGRNQITDVGLAQLGTALCNNRSIKYLNLSQNNFRDIGMRNFVQYLSSPDCPLVELSLMGNKINNDGMKFLAEFLKPNTSLRMLDLSRNAFSDIGFFQFAQEMGAHCSLTYLDISKNKELDDEGSLVAMAKALASNKSLSTLDLSGLRIRKPFLKNHFEPALKTNCTLKYVIGKIPADVIDTELKTNILIENEIEPNFQKERQRGAQSFDVALVDPENTTTLNVNGKETSHFAAALKYVAYRDIRAVDFGFMGLGDDHAFAVATYLAENPNLRSITLDGNKNLSDEGISRIASTLIKNTKLAHLSFKECNHISNEGLSSLNEVLISDNTSLFSIEFTERTFDPELSKSVKFQAQLNLGIQQHLKPVVRFSKQGTQKNSENKRNVEEVEFCKEAVVSAHFNAAIKCWRIRQPLFIQIQDQGLQDQHIIELCTFLKDRNMITRLNLKRNKITNIGAKVIANWINDHDQTLTSIDLSRNKITRAGGEALLASLKRLTRILDFQISYGNPIPLTVQLAIASEVMANNQIKQNQEDDKKQKVSQVAGRYELIDKGPIYMRCAIKSVELLRIRHLSLPDNMLGADEARLIADMIKLDPPLRTLNLEMNNLDAECAKLIAEALKFNTNLAILNISKNKLSDLGVSTLLRPLIKARLVEKKVGGSQSQIKPSLSSKQQNQMLITQAKDASKPASPASNDGQEPSARMINQVDISDCRVSTEEIESNQKSQLKILNIKENLTTIESFKAIWMLLDVNPEVIIYFDRVKHENTLDRPSNQVVVEVQQDNSRMDPDFDQEALTEFDHSRAKLRFNDQEFSQEIESKPESRSKPKIGILTKVALVLCCYKKKFEDGNTPSLKEVMGNHLAQSKMRALTFKPTVDKYLSLDRPSVQKPIQILLIAEQIVMNFCIVVPIILDTYTSCELLVGYVGLMLITEIMMILCSKTAISIPIFNIYLFVQLLSGILRKTSLLGLSVFAGMAIRSWTLVGFIVGAFGILGILIEQILIFSSLSRESKTDSDAVLVNIECTQRLAKLLQFKGLTLVFKQVSFIPSSESLILSEKISQELNPDLIEAAPVGILQRCQYFFYNQIIANETGRHVIFIDLPLVTLGVICLAWSKLDLVFIVLAAILLLDLLFCLSQKIRVDTISTNIDQDFVHQLSDHRNQQRASRYLEVLNRDIQIEVPQKSEENEIFIQDEQSSLFDTKGSEYNTIQDFEPLRARRTSQTLQIKTNSELHERSDALVFGKDDEKAEETLRV